jgi:aryl-alcohol dehydrogenase-like predicted oxidoreductase
VLDAGCTFLDTSDAYGPDGHNERLVGQAIAGATTRSSRRSGASSSSPATPRTASRPRTATRSGSTGGPSARARPCEASLRRLGVEAIDLWYLHFPDPGVPVEETVGAMGELVAEGKVRHLGLSNATADQVRAAHAAHPLAAVQAELSLWTRENETRLLPVLHELGIGLVAWGPLGNGFLAADVEQVGENDFRQNAPRFQGDNLARNRDRFAPLRAFAAEKGVEPGQLALAWLLAHDGVVPIPAAARPRTSTRTSPQPTSS